MKQPIGILILIVVMVLVTSQMSMGQLSGSLGEMLESPDFDGKPQLNLAESNPDIGAYENAFGVPGSLDECESGPDTLWFVGTTLPPFQLSISKCVHLCRNHVYAAIFPWCPDPTPEVPNEIQVMAGCSDCGNESEDCDPASGWFVTPWIMQPPYNWISYIYLSDQGTEGCACLTVGLWLGMHWTGDCWLPVELASFEAVLEGEDIRIRFATASERDNDYFDILRGTSANGDFSMIARIPSQGQSSTEQHYTYLDRDVEPGRTYWYYLADVDFSGQRTEHRDRMASATAATSTGLPLEYALAQNFPNPFNASTEIQYAIPAAGHVTLSVYNTVGQLVATLVDREQTANTYRVEFDATSLPSGVYVYVIEVNEFRSAHKMALIR